MRLAHSFGGVLPREGQAGVTNRDDRAVEQLFFTLNTGSIDVGSVGRTEVADEDTVATADDFRVAAGGALVVDVQTGIACATHDDGVGAERVTVAVELDDGGPVGVGPDVLRACLLFRGTQVWACSWAGPRRGWRFGAAEGRVHFDFGGSKGFIFAERHGDGVTERIVLALRVFECDVSEFLRECGAPFACLSESVGAEPDREGVRRNGAAFGDRERFVIHRVADQVGDLYGFDGPVGVPAEGA